MTAFSESPDSYLFEPQVDVYELTWMSGHVEQIAAVDISFFNERVTFLSDAGGRTRVVLSAREEDLRTIRSITEGESLPLGGGEPA